MEKLSIKNFCNIQSIKNLFAKISRMIYRIPMQYIISILCGIIVLLGVIIVLLQPTGELIEENDSMPIQIRILKQNMKELTIKYEEVLEKLSLLEEESHIWFQDQIEITQEQRTSIAKIYWTHHNKNNPMSSNQQMNIDLETRHAIEEVLNNKQIKSYHQLLKSNNREF